MFGLLFLNVMASAWKVKMSHTEHELRQAVALLRAGQRAEAARRLAPIVQAERDNADAWWLLANSAPTPEAARTALEQVLRLRPDHEKARRLLDQINARFPLDAAPASAPPAAAPADASGGALEEPPDSAFDAPRIARIAPEPAPPPVRPRATRARKARGGSDLTMAAIGVVGVVVVIGLALIVVLAVRGQGDSGAVTCPDAIAVPLNEIEIDRFFGVRVKGCIAPGQPVRSSVDAREDDGWVFIGNAGQTLEIALNARDRELDPVLYLYDPWGRLIGEHDDIDLVNGNMNAWLRVTLPQTGTYTIVVSAYVQGGSYELSML